VIIPAGFGKKAQKMLYERRVVVIELPDVAET
jgi:hypothetical protein